MSFFFSLNNNLPDFYDTITKWIELVGVNSGFYKYCGSTVIDNLIGNIKPKKSSLVRPFLNDPFLIKFIK